MYSMNTTLCAMQHNQKSAKILRSQCGKDKKMRTIRITAAQLKKCVADDGANYAPKSINVAQSIFVEGMSIRATADKYDLTYRRVQGLKTEFERIIYKSFAQIPDGWKEEIVCAPKKMLDSFETQVLKKL